MSYFGDELPEALSVTVNRTTLQVEGLEQENKNSTRDTYSIADRSIFHS